MRLEKGVVSILLIAFLTTIIIDSCLDGKPETPTASYQLSGQVGEPVEVITEASPLLKDQTGCMIKLITGNTVAVTYLPDGQKIIGMVSTDSANSPWSYYSFETSKGHYVLPIGADLEKLDIELFNIDYLVNEGYNKMADLPVIVSVSDADEQGIQLIKSNIQNHKGRIAGLFSKPRALSARLPLDTVKDATSELLAQKSVKKIWLDKKVHVCLNESVPLIGAPEAWDMGYNGTGVEIAILDTGIDKTHPDLDDLDDNPTTADPKVIREIDFTDEHSTIDSRGHGTHCAGIAAGTGAVSGGRNKGVAPGAKLWSVKVLTSAGWGYESWVINGIEYAAYGPDKIPKTGDEADIISMSLGGEPTDGMDPVSLAADAAVDAGVVVVVAAGNDAHYFTVSNPSTSRKAITVGASDKNDVLALFSSKGPTIDFRVKPDVLAPGVNINSCIPYEYFGQYYDKKDGTSMAAPHVAGVAALMLEACYRMPSSWSLPKYAKNTLISTAVDLGYNVYEQGGGRINVPSAVSTDILVDPATISFGFYSGENVTDEAVVTFYNVNTTSSRILALNVTVYDVSKGIQVDCTTLNTTTLNINSNSSASVLLTINTAVAKSLYSGKLVASVDTGETLQVIFGFAKLCKLSINKIKFTGYASPLDPVLVVGDPGFPKYTYLETDAYGNVSLYVATGTYHVVSIGYNYAKDSFFFTIAENVTITEDTFIRLDERNTLAIDFDPNKPKQKIANRYVYLTKPSKILIMCWSLPYPKSTLTYVSPTTFTALFNYEYYPEQYYHEDNWLAIASPEWHNLIYSLEQVTENTTLVADYSRLVRRITDFKTATVPDSAWRFNAACHPNLGGSWMAEGWIIEVPIRMVQWLSPEPAYYYGDYYRKDPEHDWDFGGIMTPAWDEVAREGSYPPGTDQYFAYGEHPFTSGASIDLEKEHISLKGTISQDTFGNKFVSRTRDVAGNLTILENGVKIFQKEIGDWFYESISFSGTPMFTAIIEGQYSLMLSTKTTTELTFSACPMQDYRPPKVTIKPQGSYLNCTVPQGEILVNVTLSDESAISSAGLEYSLDDGTTWLAADETDAFYDTYQFSLGKLGKHNYVSLRTNATDSAGNSISQTTIRGFYVAPFGDVALTSVPLSKTVIGQGYPLHVNVTVENQGDFPETFSINLLASRQLPKSTVNLSLFGSAARGWGFTPSAMSSPGPIITVNKGDDVNLTLASVDGLIYDFFVDYNGDTFPDPDEPKAPEFWETLNYQFTANTLGTFKYYCQSHKTVMYGTFIVQDPPRIEIDKQQVSLDNGVSAALQFTWDTTSFTKGKYMVIVVAGPVSGEIDTADNTYICGNVTVAVIGDITGSIPSVPDGKVDIRDIALAALAFGSSPNRQRWNPNADINCDLKVDIRDIAVIAKNFGKTA